MSQGNARPQGPFFGSLPSIEVNEGHTCYNCACGLMDITELLEEGLESEFIRGNNHSRFSANLFPLNHRLRALYLAVAFNFYLLPVHSVGVLCAP